MTIKINHGRKKRPQKLAIYGPEGVGKTTLASQFPRALFADCEGGTDHIDLARIGIASVREFREACLYLIRDNSEGFQSFIVDTVDWLAARDVEEMLKEDEKNSVEDYGYGKGYKKSEERFHELLKLLDRVNKAGVHVVLLAHSKVVKFEAPDMSGSYDRYELKLEKKISPLVKEWCDALLFLNFETRMIDRHQTGGDGKKRAIGGNKRILHCQRDAAFDAKNRHGMPQLCEASIEKLAPIIYFEQNPPGVGMWKNVSIDQAEDASGPEDTLGDRFKELVRRSGGREKVAAFLKSRGKNIDELEDAYIARLLKNATEFATAVASHSKKLVATQ